MSETPAKWLLMFAKTGSPPTIPSTSDDTYRDARIRIAREIGTPQILDLLRPAYSFIEEAGVWVPKDVKIFPKPVFREG